MIVPLSTKGLHDKNYIKIINEMEGLRRKFLNHKFQIGMLGTNNKFYSIIETILFPLKNNKYFKRYVNFFLRRLRLYLIKRKKITGSYANHAWTIETVLETTLPYPVRRVEYPWSIINGKLERPLKILDVGSGGSLFPIYLASKGNEVISIDNDKILMERVAPKLAQWAGTRVDYEIGDATNLKFDDETFDRVFCISVLEHLEEEVINGKQVNYRKQNLDVKAIKEMIRVLKPNGLLVLTFDWDEDPENSRSYKIDEVYERVLESFRYFLLEDKKPIINWNELKKLHVEAWKSFPPFSYVNEGWALGVILEKK